MITFSKNEIVSSTNVSRHFGEILNKLKDHQLERIAVLRNNQMEAVILSMDEYEFLKELAELIEHKEIYDLVMSRKDAPEDEYIPFEKVLEDAGLSYEDL